MSTNGINEVFNAGFKVKLQNRGPKSSGITFELKSVFDEMVKQGLIKDTDGKGLTRQDALNLYAKLNEMHQTTNRATNYLNMQVGQEFDYTADEMKALAQAAGYEISGVVKAPELPVLSDDIEIPGVEIDIIDDIEEGKLENKKIEVPIIGSKPVEQPETAHANNPEYDNDEKKELRAQIHEQRKEARAERREARQERRDIRRADTDFSANGQIGKIVNGKYYINGTEVTKEVYEVAKTKATSQMKPVTESKPVTKSKSAAKAKVKPFTREQICNITATVANLKYKIEGDENHINLSVSGSTGLAYGENELIKRASTAPSRGELSIGKANNLSLHHAIYMDLLNKENSGKQLSGAEKYFMEGFEKRIAEFYRDTEK